MSGSAARVVPVALVGLGGVGAAILSQLSSPPLAQKFKVVAIANSKMYLFNKDGGIKSDGFLEQLNKSGVELDVPGLIGKLSTLADGTFHPKLRAF
jgi:homoserine dehydrogenase